MIDQLFKLALPMALLLVCLGGASGCAGSVPQRQVDWRAGTRPDGRPPAPINGSRTEGAELKSPSGPQREQTANKTSPPQPLVRSAQSTAPGGQGSARPAPARPAATVTTPPPSRAAKLQTPDGASLTLSDSPIPNPLRNSRTLEVTAPHSAQATAPARHSPQTARPSAVQTVGYQEEIPEMVGEAIPENAGSLRLANLEEPDPVLADPSSVLIGEPADGPTPADSAEPDAESLGASSLPIEPSSAEQSGEIISDQTGIGQNGVPVSGFGNQALQGGPAQGPAQGHYQQGSPVYGQLLNSPQQPASQRAVQLLDEKQQMQEELQAQLKTIEGLQARLKQQDELWARARQEFLDVRSVVDKLTRENLLLKQQLEKADSEKTELARQYQNLMQTVEQTLDDLLLRAITEPPAAMPPAASPPATQPATQPAPAPPIINGQQASALKLSQ